MTAATTGDKEFLHRLQAAIHELSSSPALASPPHHASLRGRASVLILISSDEHVLLTQRSHTLRSHPGQVALPGGKQDEGDGGDDVVTALRETREEVGLDYCSPGRRGGETTGFRILGRLPTAESANHLCVTPIVAVHTTQTFRQLHSQLALNGDEVEAAFWTPLSYFATTEPTERYDVEWSHAVFVYRHYDYDVGTADMVLWSTSRTLPKQEPRHEGDSSTTTFPITGLTAHIVHALASMAYPFPTLPPSTTAMSNDETAIPRGR